jgi:hypothetical protein
MRQFGRAMRSDNSDSGVSWREAIFDDAGGRRRAAWMRGTGLWLLVAATFLLLLVNIQHDNTRCAQDCFDGGLRTYEPDHPWTSYQNAWQWDAMFVLGIAPLVAAAGGAFAVRHADGASRAARALPALALALAVAWIAWRVAAPPVDR